MQPADEFEDADEPDEPQGIHDVVRERCGIDGVGGGRRREAAGGGFNRERDGMKEGTFRQYSR